jgi:hypothetical protein
MKIVGDAFFGKEVTVGSEGLIVVHGDAHFVTAPSDDTRNRIIVTGNSSEGCLMLEPE